MTNLKGDHFEESEWVMIEIRSYKDKGQNLHFMFFQGSEICVRECKRGVEMLSVLSDN